MSRCNFKLLLKEALIDFFSTSFVTKLISIYFFRLKNSKLIEILKTLSPSEFKGFEKYVLSPYFRKGRDLTSYFNILKSFYPDFNDEKLTEEYVFKKLFPEKKTSFKPEGSLMRTLSSELFKLCKEFIVQIELNSDENRSNFYLLSQLRKRKLYKEFEKEYHNAEEVQIKTDGGSPEDIINRYFLVHALGEYHVEMGNYRSVLNSVFELGELAIVIALIRSFRITELKQLGKRSMDIEDKFLLSENFIKYLDVEKLISDMKINNCKYYPHVQVSYAIHRMTVNPSGNEHYEELKKLFKEYQNIFGHTEKYILISVLSSYCINLAGKKNPEYYNKELFELQDESLKINAYKWNNDDDFQIGTFRNMVLNAISVKEFDWLEKFINKYCTELNVSHRDNMKFYSLAHLSNAKGEYEKALDYLQKVKFDYFLFKTDIRGLYFRIYYEMDLFEQAFAIIDTIKHYVSTTKDLSVEFKERNSAFLKYASELLRMKSSGKIENADYLSDKIKNEKFIDSRRWLLEKIVELKKIFK